MTAQGDRLLTGAFFEIDLMETEFRTGPDGQLLGIGTPDTRSHFGRSAVFNAEIVFLDAHGAVVFSEPDHTFNAIGGGHTLLDLATAAESTDRAVSLP